MTDEEQGEGTSEEPESTGEGLKERLSKRKEGTSKAVHTTREPAGEFVCRYCNATAFKDGRPFTKLSDLATHTRTECEEYRQFKEKKKLAVPQREGPPDTPYKGEPDANAILRRILDTFPGLPQDAVREVMSWAELTGTPLHPAVVRDLLAQMQKVNAATATLIANKYALALQKALQAQTQTMPGATISPYQAQPSVSPMFTMPQPSTPGQWPQSYPSPMYPTSPMYQPGQPVQTFPASPMMSPWTPPQDNENLIRRIREDIVKPLEEKVSRIEERMIAPIKREVGDEGEEEIWEPVFTDQGQLLRDANGEIVYTRKVRRPRSHGLTADDVRRVVDESKPEVTAEDLRKTVREVMEEKLRPKELTADEVSKIIDEKLKEKPLTAAEVARIVEDTIKGAGEPKQDDPRITQLTQQVSGLREELLRKEKEMEKKDMERLQGTVDKLQVRLEDIARMPSGEWKSDEVKLLATAITDLTSFLKTRAPGEKVVGLAERVLLQQGPTGQAEVPVEARKTVLETLSEHGLTIPE